MAAKAGRAASSRGATPEHEPPQRKRLVLPDPKTVIKPSEERVVALKKAFDPYREVIAPPPAIVAKAKLALSVVDDAVPAAASSPVQQDDRHKLDLWLKQREAPGITTWVHTNGTRQVKLADGSMLRVEKRVDPVDPELMPSKCRPSVYHYIRNKQGNLLRVWCDAHPYTWENGVGTPSGSVCWVGKTTAEDPQAWREAREAAERRTKASQERRAKSNETQQTAALNAAQMNRVLAPIPTLLQMVKYNTKEDNLRYGVPSIMPVGKEKEAYGLAVGQHARVAHWWHRAGEVLEGSPNKRSDEDNPFLVGGMDYFGMTAGQWREKSHGLESPVPLRDRLAVFKKAKHSGELVKKAEVQVPWTAPPKVEDTASAPEPQPKKGGYAALVGNLEYVRDADAATVIKDYVLNPDFQKKALADVQWYLSTLPPDRKSEEELPPASKPVEKKVESRVDKPHKLDRRQRKKLKRQQRMLVQQENEPEVPVVVKGDSAGTTSVAGGVKTSSPRVVTVELPPAPAPVHTEEPARKPVEVRRVEAMSQSELEEYRAWAENDSRLQLHIEALPAPGMDEGYDQWDGRVTAVQLEAILGYLNDSKPLPKAGKPVMSMPDVVANGDDYKPFDPMLDVEDPDYDHKIMVMINAEQEMLMDLHDAELDAKARLRSYEWSKAMRDQSHAKTAAERQAATSTILRLHAKDARRDDDVHGQAVVAGLLPQSKVSKPPPRMIWSDIWQSDLPREDPAVIREGVYAKWKRISTYKNRYYADAHRRDVRITETRVGSYVGWSDPDVDGWSVSAPLFNDVQVFTVHSWGTKTQVLLNVPKVALLHRRKMDDRRKVRERMDNRRAAIGRGQLSRFTQWAIQCGDVSHGYAQAKTKKQLVVDSGMRQHWIYADLKPEEYGPLNRKGETYRPVVRSQSASDKRIIAEATMLDQILLGIVNYFKDEPRPIPVVSRKQAQTELKLRLQEQRANPYKYPRYMQYRPSRAMTEWFGAATGDESQRLEHWLKSKPLVENHGGRVHALRVIKQRQVPREPVVVATTTEPTQSKRPFVMTPDSNFASIIADHTRDLREAGIEVSTNDLKKLGISGEKAKPPEYVMVDGELYERAKRPAHR